MRRRRGTRVLKLDLQKGHRRPAAYGESREQACRRKRVRRAAYLRRRQRQGRRA